MTKTLETHNIFIDTEIFKRANFNYNSESFQKLISLVQGKKAYIFLTDVTVNEVKSNIKQDVRAARGAIRSLRKNPGIPILLNLLEGPIKEVVFGKLNVEDVTNLLVKQFEEFQEAVSAKIISVEGISVSEILDQYFSQKAPFGEGKKKDEFPDAFALAALRRWCDENKEKIYIISGDGDMASACEVGGPLISLSSLEAFLDLVASQEALYTYATNLLETKLDFIIKEIKEGFPEIGIWVDEPEGEVLEVQVQRIEILNKYLVSLEENNALFQIRADVEYMAKITYADLVVEEVVVHQTQETIERERIISVEVSLLFDTQDDSAFQIEHVDIKDKDIILYPGPTEEPSVVIMYDHKASVRSDIWNLFDAIGRGYSVYLYPTSGGMTVWCYPTSAQYTHQYYDPNIVEVLLANGLVRMRNDRLIPDAQTRYEFTEKGDALYNEIKDKSTQESQRTFISRIKIDWSKI
jgi:hypothetical protein